MKISVVTVCYNAVQTLEKTMLSVLNQTYPDVEYIIIDGGSTDGTVDIIKKYADRLAYWVSEPDKGIYDAMNKGIKVATGEWINFMNAGDTFYEYNTITKVSRYLYSKVADIVYGATNAIRKYGEIVQYPSQLNQIKKHMIFCHQASFVRVHLMKENEFDLHYKIASDYKFFYQQYMEKKCFLYMPICIANYDCICGVSSQQVIPTLVEYANVNGKAKRKIWKLQYIIIKLFLWIKSFFIHILPNNFLLNLLRKKNEIMRRNNSVNKNFDN